MIMIFRASLNIKRPYKIFLLTNIIFKHVKVWKRIEYMRKKLNKNMVIVKFHPRMKFLRVFFPFFLSRDDFVRGWNFMWKHPLRYFLDKIMAKILCLFILIILLKHKHTLNTIKIQYFMSIYFSGSRFFPHNKWCCFAAV